MHWHKLVKVPGSLRRQGPSQELSQICSYKMVRILEVRRLQKYTAKNTQNQDQAEEVAMMEALVNRIPEGSIPLIKQ